MKRIAELDGLRAVAVTLVVIAHAAANASRPFPITMLFSGSIGVLIFFVLSGYLITRLLLRELAASGRLDLIAFYWRRAVRILPASYAYLTFIAVLVAAGLAPDAPQRLAFAYLHLWNYQVLLAPHAAALPGSADLGHFWSLALEEQFYWVWPIALMLVRRSPARVLTAVILVVPLIRVASYIVFPGQRAQLTIMFHTGLDPLAVGALLAVHEDRVRGMIVRHRAALANGALAMLFVAMPLVEHLLGGLWVITYGRTVEAVLASYTIMLVVERNDFWLSRLLRTQPFQYVGMISFSLYLWQQVFCFPGATLALSPVPAIACALIAASASFFAIERPAQRLRRVGRRYQPETVLRQA